MLLLTSCSGYRRDAGSGDVAFRLAWNGLSDLDLFVEDPAGACIFFGQRRSDTGGILDVDCNSGTDRLCERPVENVFWPPGAAPEGPYRFWVHAHSLIPAESPLGLRISVLRGQRTAWSADLAVTRHEQLVGPFELEYPSNVVRGPIRGIDLPEGCRGGYAGVLTGPGRP